MSDQDLVDAITLAATVAVFTAAFARYYDVLDGETDEREWEISTAAGFMAGLLIGAILAAVIYAI